MVVAGGWSRLLLVVSSLSLWLFVNHLESVLKCFCLLRLHIWAVLSAFGCPCVADNCVSLVGFWLLVKAVSL
jgi:hypothetical protein